MTTSGEELRRQWRDAVAMPPGAAQAELVDTVLRHADASGEVPFAFEARRSAIDLFSRSGEYQRMLRAFAECLAVLDRHPEVVTPDAHYQLMWQFKGMPLTLVRFPELELTHIAQVFESIERHYHSAGYSMHSVAMFRMHVAVHTGRHDEAQHWHDVLVRARRDAMSHCAACVPSFLIEFYEETGQFEAGAVCAEQNKHRRCAEQPQWILTHALAPYLHTGRLELAVQAHRTAYPGMRSGATWLHGTALHLVLCGLTGNEARGLELIERHLDWLDTSPSPFQSMEFASGASLVLRRLVDAGRGDLVVRDRRANRDSQTTVDALYRELRAMATAISGQFDQRNGNDYHTRRLAHRVDQDPVVESLLL